MTQLTFLRGTGMDRHRLCLASIPDLPDYADSYDSLTRICLYDEREPVGDRWGFRDVEFGTASIAVHPAPNATSPTYVFLSLDGQIYFFGTPPVVEQIPGTTGDSGHSAGWGRVGFLRPIAGILHACGDNGQLFRRPENARWEILDRSMLIRFKDQEISRSIRLPPDQQKQWQEEWIKRLGDGTAEYDNIFYDINGAALDDIYVCGVRVGHPWQQGRLYHWDGSRLQELPVPAPEALTSIVVQDPNTIWVCGRGGQLLRGQANTGFSAVPGLGGNQAFTSMAWFRDRLYLASIAEPRGLFVYHADRLERVVTTLKPELDDVFAVSAVDDVLWTIGRKDITRFDGTGWRRIDHPDNPPLSK